MSLDSIVTSITQPTSSGTQTISGWTFAPKLLLIYSVALSADGGGGNSHFTYGAAAAGGQRGFAVMGYEAAPIYGGYIGGDSSRAIVAINDSGTVGALGQVTSTADGFSISWATCDGVPRIFVVVGLGGTDLLNAQVGVVGVGQTTISHGFTPNAILIAGFTTGHTFDDAAGFRNIHVTYGWATATGNYAVGWHVESGGDAALHWQSNDRIVLQADRSSILAQASVTGFSANTTTLAWQSAVNPTELLYVALQVTNVKMGYFTQPASPTTLPLLGFGFQPGVLLSCSGWLSNGYFDHATLLPPGPGTAYDTGVSIGAASTSSAMSVGQVAGTAFGGAPNASRFMDRTKLLTLAAANHATPTLHVIDSRVQTFNTDGVVLVYDNMADSAQRAESYLALGPGVSVIPAPTPHRFRYRQV